MISRTSIGSNDRLLFGLSYREGKDEAAVVTGYLMAVNVDGTKVRTLLGPDQGNVLVIDRNWRDWDIVDLLDDDDDNVIVAVYEHASRPLMELYRINTLNGDEAAPAAVPLSISRLHDR